MADNNPLAPPVDPGPALDAELVPGTAYAVLSAMHANIVDNFRQDLSPELDFPSRWRLAKHVVNERGPLVVYRYAKPTGG